MERRTFLKLGAAYAMGLASLTAPAVAQAAPLSDDELIENSWRYLDGVAIPQDEGIQTFSATPAWSFNGTGWVNGEGELCPGVVARGIDVSEHQGIIDWDSVKTDDVSFVIIRCGYWDVEDRYWERNVAECERLGIPYGVYLYSYAESVSDAKHEAESVLSLLGGHEPAYPVFYDMEDDTVDSTGDYANLARAFCETIENAGYTAGVYANLYWWTTKLTDPVFDTWVRWVAQYNSYITATDYEGSYRFWQMSSTGSVNGISTNVDLNFLYGLSQDEIAAGKFYDTPASAWYCRDGWVQYVASTGLMRGDRDSSTGELTGYFHPESSITRAEVATILYRCHNSEIGGDDASDYGTVSNFFDVEVGRYYTKAIEWCRSSGVVTGDKLNGQPTGFFRPNDKVTREEFATMAYRLAAFGGVAVDVLDETAFNAMCDVGSVSEFARPAMIWCAGRGLITGSRQADGLYAYPRKSATRAEAAKIITVLDRDIIGA